MTVDQLLDEPVELGEEASQEGWVPEDELQLRKLLLAILQAERDVERVAELKARIVEEYDRDIATLTARANMLRRSVQGYVERHGRVRFPDVGTAYLQKGKPKLEVEDREAFKSALGTMFVKETFDETAAKQYALERATEAGEIVNGTRLVPGGPSLRVRRS